MADGILGVGRNIAAVVVELIVVDDSGWDDIWIVPGSARLTAVGSHLRLDGGSVFKDLRIFEKSGFLDDVDGFRLLDGWDVFRFLTRLG